jgi:hypothetical protein
MIKKIDEEKKHLPEEEGEGGESGESGQGGKSGAIEFRYRDILSGDTRDDALPDSDIHHLLVVHEGIHLKRVNNQKIERKNREAIKNGLVKAQNYDSLGLRIGGGAGAGGGGGTSPYKSHPLSNHAQFSGATDRKVTGVPSDNLSETNDKDKNDLSNELDLRHRLTNAPSPKSAPRPRGPYG